MSAEHDRFRDLMNAARRAEPRETRIRLMDELLSELEPIALISEDAGVVFCCGFAWYSHPDQTREPFALERAAFHFRRALDLDPEGPPTRLYLAMTLYVQRQWVESQREADLTIESDLEIHERVMLRETLVCCQIHLHGLAHSVASLARYAAICAEADHFADQQHVWLWPLLNRLLQSASRHELEAVGPLLLRLDEIARLDSFGPMIAAAHRRLA